MQEFRKRYWYKVALCASYIPFIYSPIAYTANVGEKVIEAAIQSNIDVDKDTYTANFNNISIIEFIRFTSKITGLNFVFEEGDLQFTVTVVSEEAVTAKNMTTVLSQVLRMHNLVLLEQDGNVLITTSTNVNQIPTIVSSDLPESRAGNAALVTRIFRIKNANINSIASIIKPMTSQGALIEVSAETRQLIVTDITTNVEQIATLLTSLDAPHSPLDVDTYIVRNIPPQDLIQLTEKILSPFAEGNPLIFVPQSETNSVYIVSTPYLIDRAMSVMEDLDIPTKPVLIGKPALTGKDIFIYKPIFLSPSDLLDELTQIGLQLRKAGGARSELEIAIEAATEVKDTGSVMFVADALTTVKIKDILSAIDNNPYLTHGGERSKSTFLAYQPVYRSGDELVAELSDLQKSLKQSGLANPPLLATLDSMKWVSTADTLIFTGDPQSIERVQGILKSMDAPTPYLKSSQIYIYKPLYNSQDQILIALKALLPSLEKTNTMSDNNLVAAINSMQWNPETQSFLITSDPATIERLKELFASIDTAQTSIGASSKGFFLYKLQHAHCDALVLELRGVAKKMPTSSIQNQNLIAAIDRIECIESNNSLLITGSNDVIEQIKVLIAEFDLSTTTGISAGAHSFLIYKPKYLPAQQIQIALSDLAHDLAASGLNDPQLFKTIDTMRYVEQTNSLLFTGSQEGLDKTQNLINTIDTSAALGAIQNIGNITFFLYKVQAASPDKLVSSLKSFAADLKQSNVEDKQIAEAINTVKWIKETNSLLFTGAPPALEKIEQLVKKFDLPSLGSPAQVDRAAPTFLIYNPKYIGGEELISILCEFMENLMASGVSDPGLFDTINNLKWIDKTTSLLVSGDQQSVDKVQQLLVKFDIPSKDVAMPSIESIDNTSFLVYKLQFHPGNDIQRALQQVAASLGKGSSSPAALVDAIHSLQWIQVTNSLLCSGQQDVLVKLKELIQNLDIPLRQVFIEVLVIQTTLNNQQNFGLMWGGQVKYFNKTVLQSGNFPLNNSSGSATPAGATAFPGNLQGINATTTPTNTSIPFSTGFDLGVIGDIIMHKGKSFISLGSLLNAIQLDTDSTVILNPKIITQDNRQSTIFVGQNVPYTGALITSTTSSQTQTANIEYRDVGVSLTITPILGDGDVVTMDIVHDISQITNGTNVTTSNQQLTGIQTNHAHMETRVHVPNNHFVALSGMINDAKTHYRTAIPCLGGLPVIGALFSENDRQAQKGNIIIFVRPQIVNTYEEYKNITEHQEWLYKDNARLPVLKEEFDEGIDMVKLPENE